MRAGKTAIFVLLVLVLLMVPAAYTMLEELAAQEMLAQNRSSRNRNQPPSNSNSRHREIAARASRIISSADIDIKILVAQVFLTAVDGRETIPERTRQLLTEIPAGGVILFGYNLGPNSEQTRAYIEELSRCISDVTFVPFIATDQEGGAVQRFRGNAALPPPLSYWERLRGMENQNNAVDTVISSVEEEAAVSGRELRRIGVTMNLAPVAEILTTENMPFLGNRSYGPDQNFTIRASAAFIRGMERAGIASTLKHFPGNTAADPHYHRAVLTISEAELERKIRPFRELIHLEAPAVVMVSHVIVPTWDTIPLSRSTVAVRKLREMGFNGIIMSDDFAMVAAGASPEVSVVEALAAGVDMIIVWPRDIRRTYQAVLAALETGELSEARIREAAERVIYQKIRYGLM